MLGDANIGRWIIGQYCIERRLAIGGMGSVYLARQVSMDRFAAVKMLRRWGDASDPSQARFQREARAASRLTHPNIVTIYNFGELEDGTLFLAMEYVEGIGLNDLVEERGALPLPNVVKIMLQCATALYHAHDKGVVHRDFKPSNVMLTRSMDADFAKVLDFGLARLGSDSTSITRTGALMGTPRYMAPEQWGAGGEVKVSDKVDQYALGLVLWELCTGEPAIGQETPLECMNAHVNETLAPPSSLRNDPHIALLDPIVERLVAKDPDQRYADMGEVAAALRDAAQTIGAPKFALYESGVGAPLPDVDEPLRLEGSSDSTVLEVKQTATRVCVLGPEQPLGPDDETLLANFGLVLAAQQKRPLAGTLPDADLYLLGARASEIGQTLSIWNSTARLPDDKTLVWVLRDSGDEDTAALRDAGAVHANIIVETDSSQPLPVALALSWLRWGARGGIRVLNNISSGLASTAGPTSESQVMLPSGSGQAAAYAEEVVSDLKSQGLRRRPVLRRLGRLTEELVVNGFSQLRGSSGNVGAKPDIAVLSGRQISLRWALLDDFVAVSVRDSVGRRRSADIMRGLYGSIDDGQGGIGLRMMFQQARFLFVVTSPNRWSEVLALVDRSGRAAGKSALCVLQIVPTTAAGRSVRRQIGDRLTMLERSEDGVTTIKLDGEVNETSDFEPVFGRRGKVVLDLGNVRRINSIGTRSWLDALKDNEGELELELEACSPAIVSQINMIANFAAAAHVRSVMGPYYCESCNAEKLMLIPVEDIGDDHEPPTHTCESCGEPIEFDEHPAAYFAFLDS